MNSMKDEIAARVLAVVGLALPSFVMMIRTFDEKQSPILWGMYFVCISGLLIVFYFLSYLLEIEWKKGMEGGLKRHPEFFGKIIKYITIDVDRAVLLYISLLSLAVSFLMVLVLAFREVWQIIL